MTGNFYQYWTVNIPPANLIFIADDIPLIPKIVFSPPAYVDGTGSNVRIIVLNFSSNLIQDVQVTFKALNEFGLIVEETVTALSGNDTCQTQGFYSVLYEINSVNAPANYTVDVGFLHGYSQWIGGQYFRQSHQIIASGGVNYTVWGTLTDDFKPTITSTAADYNPFPLSTALTNITTSIVTPQFIEYPTGNVRISINDGSGSLQWTVGNMMIL